MSALLLLLVGLGGIIWLLLLLATGFSLLVISIGLLVALVLLPVSQ